MMKYFIRYPYKPIYTGIDGYRVEKKKKRKKKKEKT